MEFFYHCRNSKLIDCSNTFTAGAVKTTERILKGWILSPILFQQGKSTGIKEAWFCFDSFFVLFVFCTSFLLNFCSSLTPTIAILFEERGRMHQLAPFRGASSRSCPQSCTASLFFCSNTTSSRKKKTQNFTFKSWLSCAMMNGFLADTVCQ